MTDPIRFLLDDVGGRGPAGGRSGRWRTGRASRSRICAGYPNPATGADGNCRAWHGRDSRASGCSPPPASGRRRRGMKVHSASERAKASRQLVFELLVGDQPDRAAAHDPVRGCGNGPTRSRSATAVFRGAPRWRPTAAIRRWRCNSMPASSAICAYAPAARSRSTTSSAWPGAAGTKRSSSISTTRWGIRPASPAANVCRPARPAP